MKTVAGYVLRVTGCGLRVTCYELRVTSCGLRVAGYELWVTGYGLRVTGYELRVTGYELRGPIISSVVVTRTGPNEKSQITNIKQTPMTQTPAYWDFEFRTLGFV
ncbi:MAG: hypothetical protein JRE36_04995 [Deltaproteobacteria bacterium]|jgi:hypothetical protein|nr:hypothetical protein [Deltaproteobacteria bacterium]